MKTFVLVAVVGIATVGATVWAETATTVPTTSPTSAPAASTMNEKQKIGYMIGLQVGSRLKGMEADGEAMAAGFKDGTSGAKPRMSDEELQETMTAIKKQMMAAQMAAIAEHQKTGDAFLAENGKKDGVKTTASGLQYKVIKSGAGKTPKATDTVSVNYRGTLVNGKEFDASGAEPVSFQVNHVIPGWTEALQLMKEGDKWTLYIPSKLAYGDRGAGEAIGPNEALIFEVELLSVK